MSRFMFHLSNAFINLKSRRAVTLSMVISFFLGLLFPCVILAYISGMYESIQASFMKDMEQIVKVKFIENRQVSVNKISEENPYISDAIRYNAKKVMALFPSDMDFVDVHGADHGFRQFYRVPVIAGSFFDREDLEKGVAQCVIGEGLAIKYFGKRTEDIIGKKVNIEGTSFEVKGITNSRGFYDEIIIPFNTYQHVLKSDDHGAVYLKIDKAYNTKTQLSTLEKYFEQLGLTPSLKLEQESGQEDLRRFYTIAIVLVCAVLSVIVYSAINISSIILNKIEEDRSGIGIRMACGATIKDLYMQYICEFMIVNIVVSILFIPAVALIRGISELFLALNVLTLLSFMVAGMIFSITLSFFVIHKLLKLNVHQLLTE